MEDDLEYHGRRIFGYGKGILLRWTMAMISECTESKEVYRGDPVGMHIYADEKGERGTAGFTCLTHRDVISQNPAVILVRHVRF